MNLKKNVLIIGGGVGGLTLAIKLASCKIDVAITERLERADHLYKGELLQPKTLQILDGIGVLQEVLDSGQKLPVIELKELKKDRDGSYEKVSESMMDYRVIPEPYNYSVMIHHEKLKEILKKKALSSPRFEYFSPASCKGYLDEKARVILQEDKKELLIDADFYIGAEGRKSVTRDEMDMKIEQNGYNHHFLTVTFPRPETMVNGKIISTRKEFLGLFPLPDNQVRTVFLIPAGSFKALKEKGIEALHGAYTGLCPELDGYVQHLKDWKKVQLMIPVSYHVPAYIKNNFALIGDAAHTVHPMAGEGMNMAMQDADTLGELLCDMYAANNLDNENLKWYPYVRQKRVKKILELSHLSALAYSYPLRTVFWLRRKTLKRMEKDGFLHYKQMLNISGLGIWNENLYDRIIQLGGAPLRKKEMDDIRKNASFFNVHDDYPWKERIREGGSL
ncbi:2-polyprenyl-6-methoxyphenol hydroxylase [Bacillus sp. OV322]|uniref:FAD-dependent monooxygenase n=1 Tax=Bacillus sp. OV322 TaxID=1882764 RepID=UPI0008E07BEB|nr:NAD(P)/FAD-dependent oxidoreductase [Bacillus sp. OV322]SFC86335.1 2-polyprenyl-6-methoxyphenol hydroxylase [Bacillus sp. OV322]